MFKKNKGSDKSAVKQISSLLFDNVSVEGDLLFTDGVKISCCVKGAVQGGGEHSLLVLTKVGRIEGDVKVYDAFVDGVIVGDLHVEHILELHENAIVTGSISYRRLCVEGGAVVEGALIRLGDNVSENPGVTLQSFDSSGEDALIN